MGGEDDVVWIGDVGGPSPLNSYVPNAGVCQVIRIG
jgi:hypothetical protein